MTTYLRNFIHFCQISHMWRPLYLGGLLTPFPGTCMCCGQDSAVGPVRDPRLYPDEDAAESGGGTASRYRTPTTPAAAVSSSDWPVSVLTRPTALSTAVLENVL